MYKLISLDLDGTLFDSSTRISDRNKKAIDRCKALGIITVVATGRPPRFTFEKLPLDLTDGYCICYNGARIYNHRNLIKETCLEGLSVEAILNRMSAYKVALECFDHLYSNFDMSKTWPDIKCRPISDLEDYHHVSKLLILNEEALDYEAFYKAFQNECNIINTNGGRLIEVMAKGVNKCTALNWIINQLDLKFNEVVAFGDDHNDIEILTAVGLGVAMKNGNEFVKAIANTITESNDNDGVAIVLERIVEALYE